MEYEVLPQVDEFCRVDGAEFNFVHIPCLELSSASDISELHHDEELSKYIEGGGNNTRISILSNNII